MYEELQCYICQNSDSRMYLIPLLINNIPNEVAACYDCRTQEINRVLDQMNLHKQLIN